MNANQLRRFRLRKSAAVIGSALAMLSAYPAAGQDIELEEVVVTGTLIRGVEQTGSNITILDSATISELSPSTANDLLSNVPQVANFFNDRPEQDPRGASRNTVNIPNLRNLPGINEASGATTLILVDGHRMSPVGVQQSTFDPDMIPAIVMERVEVLTDGGSSIYGADAVGGVINFVTRDDFEGVRVDLGYDFGDDYDSSNIAVMAGTRWQGGSGYVAVAQSSRDEVLNGDVEWGSFGQWSEDGTTLSPSDVQCTEAAGSQTIWRWIPPTVNPLAPPPGLWTNNPLAGAGTTPLGDGCDNSLSNSYLPEQDRTWVYGGFNQEVSEGVSLNLKAYHSSRELTLRSDPRGGTVADPTPQDAGAVGSAPFEAYIQNELSFSYDASSAYVDTPNVLEIDTWGVTPEFTFDLDNDWRLLTTLHYGSSNSKSRLAIVDQSLERAALDAGTLDPSDVAAADASVIRGILDRYSLRDVEQELFYLRAIADGTIGSMPAGDVRFAVGAQYSDQDVEVRAGEFSSSDFSDLQSRSNDRDVTSLFAELNIPLREDITVALSARYDDYSDFGDTTNPSIGFTWAPSDWLEIFGKWGESFNAPTAIDPLLPGVIEKYVPFAAGIVPDNGVRDPSRVDAVLAEGKGGALKPQTAETWAVGFNLQPMDGLRVNVNYYDIEFVDLLGAVNPQSAVAVEQNPEKFIFNPTQEQWDDFLAQVDNGADYADRPVENIGVIVDRRLGNTDAAFLSGLDLSVSYGHDTEFGRMSYGLSGTKTLDFDVVSNGNSSDLLAFDNSDLSLLANVGWEGKNARASLRVKYSDGFNSNPATGAANQTSVDSFTVADLHLGYDFDDSLTVNLTVNNLFDEEPPQWRLDDQPRFNFWTLGRVMKLSISKTF